MLARTLNDCAYLQTEPLPKFMDLQSMDRRKWKFQQPLGAELSHQKSLMEIYHWQREQGRWFLHEDPHHSWSRSTKALQTLESVSGARVTKTKQFGTFMTNCHPIVEELAASVTKSEMFADCFCHISSARPATNTEGDHWSR